MDDALTLRRSRVQIPSDPLLHSGLLGSEIIVIGENWANHKLADFCTSLPFLLVLPKNQYVNESFVNKEKIKESLKVIDKLIKHYEYYHGLFVTSNQPDKVTVTKESIENLEEIKKILES